MIAVFSTLGSTLQPHLEHPPAGGAALHHAMYRRHLRSRPHTDVPASIRYGDHRLSVVFVTEQAIAWGVCSMMRLQVIFGICPTHLTSIRGSLL